METDPQPSADVFNSSNYRRKNSKFSYFCAASSSVLKGINKALQN